MHHIWHLFFLLSCTYMFRSLVINVFCCMFTHLQDCGFDENCEKAFYDSDEEKRDGVTQRKPYVMDPDHRLLLRNIKPLLQSRNTAVSTHAHKHVLYNVWVRCDAKTLDEPPLSLTHTRTFQVVMAVAQLYWHVAPKHELNIISKSLVRLLRSHRYRHKHTLTLPYLS